MLNIDAIQNGIVIDHITAGTSMTLYNLLSLDKLDCSVAIIRNVRSGKSGKKDIIKIEDCPAELNLDMLAYLDPNITIVTIKDGAIVKKERPSLRFFLKVGLPFCGMLPAPASQVICCLLVLYPCL